MLAGQDELVDAIAIELNANAEDTMQILIILYSIIVVFINVLSLFVSGSIYYFLLRRRTLKLSEIGSGIEKQEPKFNHIYIKNKSEELLYRFYYNKKQSYIIVLLLLVTLIVGMELPNVNEAYIWGAFAIPFSLVMIRGLEVLRSIIFPNNNLMAIKISSIVLCFIFLFALVPLAIFSVGILSTWIEWKNINEKISNK